MQIRNFHPQKSAADSALFSISSVIAPRTSIGLEHHLRKKLLLSELFLNSRATTTSLSEVVEFSLSNVTATLHSHAVYERAVRLKRSLNANTVRNLTDSER